MVEFGGIHTARSIGVDAAGNQHVAAAEQSDAGVRTLRGHPSNHNKFMSPWIILLDRVGNLVPDPSAENENLTGRQQNRCVADASNRHVARPMKLIVRRIEDFSRTVEILISAHTTRHQHRTVEKKGGALIRSRFEHRNRGLDDADATRRCSCTDLVYIYDKRRYEGCRGDDREGQAERSHGAYF